MKSLKTLVREFQEADAALSKLLQEEASTCDKVRYREIIEGRLVHKAEVAKKEARQRLQDRVRSLTGLPAYMFKELI